MALLNSPEAWIAIGIWLFIVVGLMHRVFVNILKKAPRSQTNMS